MPKLTRSLAGLAAIALASIAATAALAQGTVKIGLIMPYSGQFADTATQMDNAIKLYMKQHGDSVAGKKIEIIRKDTGGIAPDVAKRLAQEMVVRGVDSFHAMWLGCSLILQLLRQLRADGTQLLNADGSEFPLDAYLGGLAGRAK